ncbi:MAG: hypothetical protein LQ343_007111 [Gyalolechia ehrenbergii]|nr:MAG: hypothetical protein LQ343_007111 [Gyalolechia ehrenbergii]
MDEATANAVLSLQLDDLNRLLDSPGTGNSKSVPSDYRLVLTVYRDELLGRLSILHDRRMGRSIANAVVADQGTLTTVRNLENDAIRDQAAACRFDEQLNGEFGENTRKIANANRPASFIDLTDNLNDSGMDRFTRINSLQPGVVNLITWAKSRRKSNPVPSWGTQGLTPASNTLESQHQPEEGNIKPFGQDQRRTESSLKRKAVDGDDSTDERVAKVTKLDHAHLSSGPQKRIADADTVLDNERSVKRVRDHGSFTGLEDPILGVKKACACCNDSVHYFAAVYAPCGHDYCRKPPLLKCKTIWLANLKTVIILGLGNSTKAIVKNALGTFLISFTNAMTVWYGPVHIADITASDTMDLTKINMIGGLLFTFWRFGEIVTLIPTLGMLVPLTLSPLHRQLLTSIQAYFVHQFESQNLLTPNSVLVLFIVSVLAAAWAIVTVFRRKSTRDSANFVSLIDLAFVGAFIAGVYELRYIANADCTNFSANSHFSITVNNNGVSGSSPFRLNTDKNCAMLKASFAFGIMNCIFFFITSFLLLFMHRKRDDRNVEVKETYRRRSHDSR